MSIALDKPIDVWASAEADDVASLRTLMGEGGGSENLDMYVDERDDHGRTALHAASSKGAESAVRFLLSRGANPNKADRESHWTSLHRALYHGHLRIALLLLRAGAVLGDELTPWQAGHHLRGGKNNGSRNNQTTTRSFLDKKESSQSRKDGVDKDGLTPLSLLSWRLRKHLQEAVRENKGGDVVTFGKADFPLGYPLPNTSNVQKPRRVEALADVAVVAIAAARHHSVVLDKDGRVFTWGHGRGGRLGHGDENPQMFPKLVAALDGLRVVKIAAAENHTVCVTDQGLVFSWGSDRFGQLGVGGSSAGHGTARLVPRRVEALRRCMVADVSAGATHTVAVTREGEVYTWGGNKSGQLGYEGVGAIGDGVPRMVSLLYHRANGKDPRRAIQVSAGCSCTLVVVAGAGPYGPNKVFQFGYGSHVPIRVDFRPAEKAQRETGKRKGRGEGRGNSGSTGSKDMFWAVPGGACGGARINVVQVSAGRHHNVALASTGLVFTWGLGADQLGLGVGGAGQEEGGVSHTTCPRVVHGMGQDRGVFVSASAGHTCVVSENGDLYSWGSTDGKQGILGHGHGSWQPVPKRVVGLKRGVKVAAGPEHTVVLLLASSPALPHPHAALRAVRSELVAGKKVCEEGDGEEEADSRSSSPFSDTRSEADGNLFEIDDVETFKPLSHGSDVMGSSTEIGHPVPAVQPNPSLKELCERTIAAQVDMRNAISVLAHAEALDAKDLAGFCVEFVQRNLDGILVAGRPADLDFLLEDAADDVNTLFQDAPSSLLANTPHASQLKEQSSASAGGEATAARPSPVAVMLARVERGQDPTLEEALRLERGLKKRMTQVVELARMEADGTTLSPDQIQKLSRRSILEKEAIALVPLLARLRMKDQARTVGGRVDGRGIATEASCLVKEQKGPSGGELIGEHPLVSGFTPDKHGAVSAYEEKSFLTPSPTKVVYSCEACHVTCATESIWQGHIKGKRHSKCVAKAKAEAAAKQAVAEEETARVDMENDKWQRGVGLPPPPPCPAWKGSNGVLKTPPRSAEADPTSEATQWGAQVGPATPLLTPPSGVLERRSKSFREILEEEERQAAMVVRSGRRRGMSVSDMNSSSAINNSSHGKPLGHTISSPSSYGRRTTSSASTSGKNYAVLQPLVRGANVGGHGEERKDAGEGTLLSAYLKLTPSAPRPVAPALSSASRWASGRQNDGSGSASNVDHMSRARSASVGSSICKDDRKASDAMDGCNDDAANGSSPTLSGATFEGRSVTTPSFEEIMAEEERKAALVRFSGNNCPWFSGRRERSDSFEVIQKQQLEQETLREEEEARAMAEALAVAAAEEEKEREQAKKEKQILRKQRKQSKEKQGKHGQNMQKQYPPFSTSDRPLSSCKKKQDQIDKASESNVTHNVQAQGAQEPVDREDLDADAISDQLRTPRFCEKVEGHCIEKSSGGHIHDMSRGMQSCKSSNGRKRRGGRAKIPGGSRAAT